MKEDSNVMGIIKQRHKTRRPGEWYTSSLEPQERIERIDPSTLRGKKPMTIARKNNDDRRKTDE